MSDNDGQTMADAGRRAILTNAFRLSIGLSLTPVVALAQGEPSSIRPKEGDWFVKIGDATLTPLTPADVPLAAAPVSVWAMDPADKTVRSGSRLNRVILVKFDADAISAATRERAAAGVLAFTAICTHSGCEIADWLPDEQLLYCACHSTKFDVKDGARVVDGPAPRSLPALPLKIVDGNLAVARSFTSRVGFEEI